MFGAIALIVSIVLMGAVFIERLENLFRNFLEARPKSRWQALCQVLYWVAFTLTYITGWLNSLSRIAREGHLYEVMLTMGFVWFVIIMFVYLCIAFHGRPGKPR